MPFWDLQQQLGIDVDRWLLRQSMPQPHGNAGACHAFEREWVECGHGLGQTRARRECQPEYEDFMECMHRTKLVSGAGEAGAGLCPLPQGCCGLCRPLAASPPSSAQQRWGSCCSPVGSTRGYY